jgi:HD-GYP domain-containing protein (c-di-GMP phosphodiesterase class II)
VAEGILHHHEWWNGMGYPDGLKGGEIPIESRIISIVDAYDVMRNGRPYKKKMTREEAIEELRRCSGTQFDPALVEIFIEKVLHEKAGVKEKKTKRKKAKSRVRKST